MAYCDKYQNETCYGPSMATIRARQRVAIGKGKCACGVLRDPSEVHRAGSRAWTSCNRCFGLIKQHS